MFYGCNESSNCTEHVRCPGWIDIIRVLSTQFIPCLRLNLNTLTKILTKNTLQFASTVLLSVWKFILHFDHHIIYPICMVGNSWKFKFEFLVDDVMSRGKVWALFPMLIDWFKCSLFELILLLFFCVQTILWKSMMFVGANQTILIEQTSMLVEWKIDFYVTQIKAACCLLALALRV